MDEIIDAVSSSLVHPPSPQDLVPAFLWEKQEDETPRAFSAFKAYRDLHASIRSLRKAVIVIYGVVTAGKLRQFGKWSSRYSWVIRSTAWDEEKDKLERLASTNQITDAKSRHLAVAKALQGIAIEKLKEIKAKDVTSVEMMLKIIDQSYKMEREVLGMNDITITETEMEAEELSMIVDISALPTSELRKRIAQRRLHVTTNNNPD